MNEKMKKVITTVCATAIVATMGITALATASTATPTPEASSQTTMQRGARQGRPQLTDEQKTQMQTERDAQKAKMDETQAKWDALTDAQKEEIYALKDQATNTNIQAIDKYVEFGLIDEATATEMKTRMTEAKTNMRTEGHMPMMGMGGKRGGGDKGVGVGVGGGRRGGGQMRDDCTLEQTPAPEATVVPQV